MRRGCRGIALGTAPATGTPDIRRALGPRWPRRRIGRRRAQCLNPRSTRRPNDPTTPPNVVLFLTDQQRWDTTGLGGCPLELTPNLDRIGCRGTHVVNAVTPQPVCAPARAALQTGRWPTQTGVYRNGIPLPTPERTLGHRFAEAGYETALIGKWHLVLYRV